MCANIVTVASVVKPHVQFLQCHTYCSRVLYVYNKICIFSAIVVDQCKISKISSEIKLSDIKTFGLYHDPSLNEYTAYLVYGDTEIGTIQSRNEERLKELLQVIQQQNRQGEKSYTVLSYG